MAKRRICEDKVGRTGKSEVRLVGWGSSLLDEATNSSPHLAQETALRTALRTWKTHTRTAAQTEPIEAELQERVAHIMARNNRRYQPRLAQSAEITIQQFSCEVGGVISAEVQNLSRGGICIASRVPLMRSSVVQCVIGVPDVGHAIPTLMHVVWVEETGASQYEVGLQYLF